MVPRLRRWTFTKVSDQHLQWEYGNYEIRAVYTGEYSEDAWKVSALENGNEKHSRVVPMDVKSKGDHVKRAARDMEDYLRGDFEPTALSTTE